MSPTFEWGVQLLRPVSEEQARSLAQRGLDRIPVHLPWRWWEQRRGVLDAKTTDWFLRPLRAERLPLLGVLGPALPHLLPDHALTVDDADFVARFSRACADAVALFPDIDVFRVEGELNAAPLERRITRRRRGRAWADPAFGAELLRSATGSVRAARPDACIQITVHASVPGWRRHLQRWLRAGVVFDRLGLVLQPALLLPDPELGRRVGDAVAQAQRIVGPGVPVEVAKIGYPTTGPRFTPRTQREFLVIAADAARASGAAGLTWWALRDQAHHDPMLRYWTPAQQRRYGLLYFDGTPKPAADELRVLATGDRFGGGGTS